MMHIICTPYNLGIYENKQFGGKVDEWMDHRLELFRRFTAPSVLAQTSQKFIWLIALHDHTPSDYIRRLYKAVEYRPNVLFILTQDKYRYYSGFDGSFDFASHMKPFVTEDHHVISTSLDSDDALSVDFINQVQLKAKEVVEFFPFIIDTVRIYVVPEALSAVCIKDSALFMEYSMMPSVVEDPKIFKGIYGYQGHWTLREEVPQRHFVEAPTLHVKHEDSIMVNSGGIGPVYSMEEKVPVEAFPWMQVLCPSPWPIATARARFIEIYPEFGTDVSFCEVLNYAVERCLPRLCELLRNGQFQLVNFQSCPRPVSLKTYELLEKVSVEFNISKAQLVRGLLGLLGLFD